MPGTAAKSHILGALHLAAAGSSSKRIGSGEYRKKTRDVIAGPGATDPIRTDDLLITSELLYQLSHSSMEKCL